MESRRKRPIFQTEKVLELLNIHSDSEDGLDIEVDSDDDPTVCSDELESYSSSDDDTPLARVPRVNRARPSTRFTDELEGYISSDDENGEPSVREKQVKNGILGYFTTCWTYR